MGDAERTGPADRGLPQRVMREACTGFHVVNARAVGGIAFDAIGQAALDEAHGMNRIEMAQDQNARRDCPPVRADNQVIAAAARSGTRSSVTGRFRMVVRHLVHKAVDLIRPLRLGVSISTQRRMWSRIRSVENMGIRLSRERAGRGYHLPPWLRTRRWSKSRQACSVG